MRICYFGPKGSGKRDERFHPRNRLLPEGEELPVVRRPTADAHDPESKSQLVRVVREMDFPVSRNLTTGDVVPCEHCAGAGEDCPHCDGDGFRVVEQ